MYNYYAFGMPKPNIYKNGALIASDEWYEIGDQTYNQGLALGSGSEFKYRFGFNTQEKSDEIAGIGNHNTALFWEYDTRLGRRWNLDPVDQVSISNYACFANNPILLTDVLGDQVDSNRKKGMNFFITASKAERMKDIKEHTPDKGILRNLRGWFSSAYAVDNFKARIKSVLSLGRIKVITADNGTEAADKIIKKLGAKGYVENLTIDFHSGSFGSESLSSGLSGLSKLANGYSGVETTCYLGNCWAGGNTSGRTDYTDDASKALDGATTYGNQSAASSISFALFSHFTGVVPQSYSTSSSNTKYIGVHTVSKYNPATGQTTRGETYNFLKITNSGSIIEMSLQPIINIWGKNAQAGQQTYKQVYEQNNQP